MARVSDRNNENATHYSYINRVEGSRSDAKVTYKFGETTVEFGCRTYLMGILNVTPDSFSDGGAFFDQTDAILHAFQMVKDGADIIDVGGESTRPGAEHVTMEEETKRVVPVIQKLRQRTKIPISVDTYKAKAAAEALKAGANIVNDITGLHADPEIAEVIARAGASVVVMHMKGTPKDMQINPVYDDLVGEVYGYLAGAVEMARSKGINQIMVDPGIGFGKTADHNLELINRLSEFRKLGVPVLIGVSRKSFIGKILDTPVESRLEGTAAAVTASILRGADIVRVHDVREMRRVAMVADAIRRQKV
jgi:dihydropteroate synthase